MRTYSASTGTPAAFNAFSILSVCACGAISSFPPAARKTGTRIFGANDVGEISASAARSSPTQSSM